MSTHDGATIHDLLSYRLMRMAKDPKPGQGDLGTRRDAASAAAFAALAPRDPVDAMLAAEAIAAHNAAMDSFRGAAQPGVGAEQLLRLLKRAESLSRKSERSIKALERRQATVPAIDQGAGDRTEPWGKPRA